MRLRFRQTWPLKPPLPADGSGRKPTNQRDLLRHLNHSGLPSTHDGRVQQDDATSQFGYARGGHQTEQSAQ